MTGPISVSSVSSVTGEHEAKSRPFSLSPQRLGPSPEYLATELTELTEPGTVDHLTAARSATADEHGARALARELARRPDTVTLERDLLRAVVLLARRAVRTEADLATVDAAQLIARTEGGPRR